MHQQLQQEEEEDGQTAIENGWMESRRRPLK